MAHIGDTADFPGDGTYPVTLDGMPLLVVRRAEAFFVYMNRCPHTRESLDPMGGSVLSADGLLLECQRHAAQFITETGECVGGPCPGEFLEALPCIVSAGGLYLD